MTTVDEARILLGEPIAVTKFLSIKQPTVKEVLRFGEKEYLSLIHTLTSEPFDMPYYLDQMGIDFEKITPFELFIVLIQGISDDDIKFLFGDIDFSEFRIVQRELDIVLMNNKGDIIDAGVREIIADNLRRMHCLSKNEITSCYNSFAHKLLIKKQKRDIEQARKRIEMFGEHSEFASLISSLACEWHSYDAVLNLTIAQFYDAVIRSGYKESAESLSAALRAGTVRSGSYSKKDLDWRRPIKIKPL
jgi:hypothetical protein